MNTQEVKEYLIDFQKKELPMLTERGLKIEDSEKIKSIIGPRRAGKTFFLFQKIRNLIENNVKKENIIYLNFEDPKLIDITYKEFREIIKLQWELYPQTTEEKLYLFIDEPQNIKNWETAVRGLQDDGFDIFLTGSSSKLLGKEIATSLRGRTLTYTLLPFSFREFLKMKNIFFDISKLSSKEKSVLMSLLNEYIDYGGFAEVIIEKEQNNKIKIISEYFNSIIYRDIVERYKIKNTQLIKWLIKMLIAHFSNEISVHKIYLLLKSKSIKVSKNTLYSYFSMLEESLFIFPIPKFEYSIQKTELHIKKVYLCDIGFAKLGEITKDIGKKIENIVFLELERRKGPLTELSYWKSRQQEEVDFVIKDGSEIKQLIQVCYNIEDIDTKKREIKSLIKASRELNCNNLFIITFDYEAEEKIEDKKISYVPIWKLLLED